MSYIIYDICCLRHKNIEEIAKQLESIDNIEQVLTIGNNMNNYEEYIILAKKELDEMIITSICCQIIGKYSIIDGNSMKEWGETIKYVNNFNS